jgi:hypothetical protein
VVWSQWNEFLITLKSATKWHKPSTPSQVINIRNPKSTYSEILMPKKCWAMVRKTSYWSATQKIFLTPKLSQFITLCQSTGPRRNKRCCISRRLLMVLLAKQLGISTIRNYPWDIILLPRNCLTGLSRKRHNPTYRKSNGRQRTLCYHGRSTRAKSWVSHQLASTSKWWSLSTSHTS